MPWYVHPTSTLMFLNPILSKSKLALGCVHYSVKQWDTESRIYVLSDNISTNQSTTMKADMHFQGYA
jgi:hypothetical protein